MTVNRYQNGSWGEVVDVAVSEGTGYGQSATVLVKRPDGSWDQIYPSDTLPDSLIHEYKIDESSGQTLTDSVGNEDISTNFTNWVAGSQYEGGYAVRSDGVDDTGSAGSMGSFGSNMDTDFAIEFVFSTTSNGFFLRSENANDETDLVIGTDTSFDGVSNKLNCVTRSGPAGGEFSNITTASDITTGELYHVIWNKVSNDPSNWGIQINGVDEDTNVQSNIYKEGESSDFNTTEYFNGLAADTAVVRWYNDSLSDTQKQDLWNRQPFE